MKAKLVLVLQLTEDKALVLPGSEKETKLLRQCDSKPQCNHSTLWQLHAKKMLDPPHSQQPSEQIAKEHKKHCC